MDLEMRQLTAQQAVDSGVEKIPAQEATEMRRLIRRIRRKDPVRQAAETFLNNGTISPQTPQLLLQTLKKPRPYFWRRQAVAAWMLGHKAWQPEDIDSAEAAEKRLIKIVDGWALQNTWYRLLRALIWGGGICALFFGMTLFQSRSLGASWFIFILVFGGASLSIVFGVLLLPFLVLVERGKITRLRMAGIAALGRLRSVEGLPALTRACIGVAENDSFSILRYSRKMRGMALNAMAQALPDVTEYDYARLASGLPTLCRVLENLAIKPHQEAQLSETVALWILAALGKVGDGRAVASVQRVQQHALTQPLRLAATGVLPLLQDRQRQENAANTLLRGASPNMEAQETLLRAATGVEYTDPSQLLRSSLPAVSETLLEPATAGTASAGTTTTGTACIPNRNHRRADVRIRDARAGTACAANVGIEVTTPQA